jgi:hypothetical protein
MGLTKSRNKRIPQHRGQKVPTHLGPFGGIGFLGRKQSLLDAVEEVYPSSAAIAKIFVYPANHGTGGL